MLMSSTFLTSYNYYNCFFINLYVFTQSHNNKNKCKVLCQLFNIFNLSISNIRQMSYFNLKFRMDFLGHVKNVMINILFFTVLYARVL